MARIMSAFAHLRRWISSIATIMVVVAKRPAVIIRMVSIQKTLHPLVYAWVKRVDSVSARTKELLRTHNNRGFPGDLHASHAEYVIQGLNDGHGTILLRKM